MQDAILFWYVTWTPCTRLFILTRELSSVRKITLKLFNFNKVFLLITIHRIFGDRTVTKLLILQNIGHNILVKIPAKKIKR